jgi:RNA polymerase sigma-70 factor, ECF subfamily
MATPRSVDPVLDSVSEEDLSATFATMICQYSALLNRIARSVIRDADETEGVVQETFLRALRHHEKIAELQDTRKWLIRIAWNLALDRRRRRKAGRRTDDFEELSRSVTTTELSADASLIGAQRHAEILDLVSTLPAKERKIFLLSAVNELSTVEIALVLKTTDSTVRSRLYRAPRRSRP